MQAIISDDHHQLHCSLTCIWQGWVICGHTNILQLPPPLLLPPLPSVGIIYSEYINNLDESLDLYLKLGLGLIKDWHVSIAFGVKASWIMLVMQDQVVDSTAGHLH
jgi:hypothetical protein